MVFYSVVPNSDWYWTPVDVIYLITTGGTPANGDTSRSRVLLVNKLLESRGCGVVKAIGLGSKTSWNSISGLATTISEIGYLLLPRRDVAEGL